MVDGDDLELIRRELERNPTDPEEALFENLWSEHCAYSSSRPFLDEFVEGDGTDVVIGPGDDAAVIALDEDTYITMGIESHNHPSQVDPFNGAATGIGGIVRDTLSMGAHPIGLQNILHFGQPDESLNETKYSGVVDGISHYGNCIGVPNVGGGVNFHPKYEGNPLVNVGCVGLVEPENVVTAAVKEKGNKLMLVGNPTGRDGIGGASFASEDLGEDAESEEQSAVQSGHPYDEKRLIDFNREIIDEDLVEAARDLGAAGFGGASVEMVAQGDGDYGAEIYLDRVPQSAPDMNPMEILLAETQERMCYEVTPGNVARIQSIADDHDMDVAEVVGTVSEGNYTCYFDGEEVVDVDADFLAEGAPLNDFEIIEQESNDSLDDLDIELGEAVEQVLGSINTASKEPVFIQYDQEVQTRTFMGPGDDAAVLGDLGGDYNLVISSGSNPNWTESNPYLGARAVVLENQANIAVKGGEPVAMVDCFNAGNPEKPKINWEIREAIRGMGEQAQNDNIPVVGGNVSLYNDSHHGPVPPTVSVMMAGRTEHDDITSMDLEGEGELYLVDLHQDGGNTLGGSEFLRQQGETDRFPQVSGSYEDELAELRRLAADERVLASHDISDGGAAVALAEMVNSDYGAAVNLEGDSQYDVLASMVGERPGRAIIQSVEAIDDDYGLGIKRIGQPTHNGTLRLEDAGDLAFKASYEDIQGARAGL